MKGAFLAEEDARLFDHSFFGMTGVELETLHPHAEQSPSSPDVSSTKG